MLILTAVIVFVVIVGIMTSGNVKKTATFEEQNVAEAKSSLGNTLVLVIIVFIVLYFAGTVGMLDATWEITGAK